MDEMRIAREKTEQDILLINLYSCGRSFSRNARGAVSQQIYIMHMRKLFL